MSSSTSFWRLCSWSDKYWNVVKWIMVRFFKLFLQTWYVITIMMSDQMLIVQAELRKWMLKISKNNLKLFMWRQTILFLWKTTRCPVKWQAICDDDYVVCKFCFYKKGHWRRRPVRYTVYSNRYILLLFF